jgi:hypothetical protein
MTVLSYVYCRYEGPLLPFDVLMQPVHHSFKLALSASHSLHIHPAAIAQHSSVPSYGRKLRLGFMSYDICDHPTAHMLEAVFALIAHAKDPGEDRSMMTEKTYQALHRYQPGDSRLFNGVELVLFTFGNNDNSTIRDRLIKVHVVI